MDVEEPQSERRCQASYAVDAEASLVIFNHGSAQRARMFQLGMDGCRVRADRYVAFTAQAGVEVTFKINSIALRLAGTMQWLDARQTANIQFRPMPARRREALQDLLEELEAQRQAEERAEKLAEAAGKPSKPLKAGVLSMRPGPRNLESPAMAGRPDPGPAPPRDIQFPLPISTPESGPAAPIAKPAAAPKPPARPSGRDRREQSRQAVDTRATVFFIDVRAQISGRILDLSMSGCRIHTDERFPVGIYRRVETEFNLEGMPFRLAGVVQSLHDRFTVGIRFLDMSARKREQLQELMAEMEQQEQGNRE